MNPGLTSVRNRWSSHWASCRESLCDVLFPPCCVVCESPIALDEAAPRICVTCQRDCFESPWPMCPRCGARIRLAPTLNGCRQCHGDRFGFSRAVALGNYAKLLREVIYRFKRPYQDSLAYQMGRQLGRLVRSEFGNRTFDLVVPVPTHFWRFWTRRGNPAATLARGVSFELGVRPTLDLLQYTRATRKQGLLSRSQRIENAKDSMRVRRRYTLRPASVLLIDDVMASGATANEAARALKRAGAVDVHLALVGRGLGRY